MDIRKRTYGGYESTIYFPSYCPESICNSRHRSLSCREPVLAPRITPTRHQSLVMFPVLSFFLSFVLLVVSIAELGAGDRYVFYPKDGKDQRGAMIITADLRAFVADPSTLYISTSIYIGVLYWSADMTAFQASKFERSHQNLVYFPPASIF